MVDRLLRVHIQSPAGLWAWVTLSYNILLVWILGKTHDLFPGYQWSGRATATTQFVSVKQFRNHLLVRDGQ